MLPSATAASQSCWSAICSPLTTRPLLVSMVFAGSTTSLGAGGGAQAAVAMAMIPTATATMPVRRMVLNVRMVVNVRVELVMSGHILRAEAAGKNCEDSDDHDVQQAQFGGLLEGPVVVGVEDRDGQQAGVGGEQEEHGGQFAHAEHQQQQERRGQPDAQQRDGDERDRLRPASAEHDGAVLQVFVQLDDGGGHPAVTLGDEHR